MNELYEHHQIIVDPGQIPVRIDIYISKRLDNITRSQVQKAAKEI
jgi:23S rRNA pseudouridine1911/1915/1917 synthase